MMKVYMTQCNADMTEGRGPMVDDLCFKHKKHAENYIDSKQGIMGSREQWSKVQNGSWKIIEIEVIEKDIVDTAESIKKRALSKLSAAERKALGY
jgi:hypothetical protein